MKKLFTILFTFSLLFSLGTFVVEGQTNSPTQLNTPNQPSQLNTPNTPSQLNTSGQEGGISIKLQNPFRTGDSLYDLIRAIINNIILPIGGVLAVLAFIYSGFLYVTAQGDSGKIKDAHNALLYTAIGTAILLGSWVIASVIENTIKQIF